MIETDDFRIPVVSKEIALQFPDGQLVPGLVFIPASAPDHDGPMRLVEWLNDGTAFFPFKPHGEETPVLVSKANVLTLTAYHERDRGDDGEIDEAYRISVRVYTAGNLFEGQIVADMPYYKNRALDILNRADAFVFLLNDGREIHINKKYIVRAMEIEKA